jgi:hypothetical protein
MCLFPDFLVSLKEGMEHESPGVQEIMRNFLYKKKLRQKYYEAMDKSFVKYPVNNPFDAVPFEDPRVFEFITAEDYIEIIENLPLS